MNDKNVFNYIVIKPFTEKLSHGYTANLVQIYVGGSEVSNIECNCPWSCTVYL